MKHIIVSAMSVEELNEKIQDHIDEGFEPVGSIFDRDGLIHQAMIYEDENDRPQPVHYDDGGISPSDIGTLALIQGLSRPRYPYYHPRPYRRW